MRIGEAEVHNWLANNKYRNLYEALSERVKGQEDIEKVVANVYNYLQCVDARRAHNNNMIIAAPSGCGKTETFRALRDYFRQHMPSIPVYQVDISSVTQDGFKGKNVSEIVRPLMEVAADTDGIGIVFLDEFDKKITPTYSQSEENVNLAVQSQLLTLVEGRECRELFGSIDTSRTLFIGLGSFDSVRMKKGEIVKHLGFGSKNEGGVEHFTPITRTDMINLGATYELIGRFSTVVNYHELSEDMTKEVIKHISERVGKSYGCKMNVSEEFMNFLIANRKSRYGCRLFESHIREAAFEAYMDIMRNDVDITKCEIVLINEGHSMYVLNGADVQGEIVEGPKDEVGEGSKDEVTGSKRAKSKKTNCA